MSILRDIGAAFGLCEDNPRPTAEPERNNRACYHASQRRDCFFYQKGSCTCDWDPKWEQK